MAIGPFAPRNNTLNESRSAPITMSLFRAALVLIMCSAVFGCKIVITVPEGGKVVSEDGFECLGGQTCELEVSDTTFDSTFTVIPAAGNTFTRWKKADRHFCGNSGQPCRLRTTGFAGNQKLLDILASDQEFYLEPMFVGYNVTYWKKTLAQIDKGNFSTDSFLYASEPIVGQCDPGAMNDGPKTRSLQALNQTRKLHDLPGADYAPAYNMQVQESSLVQRANNYPGGLNHFPSPGDACYSQAALDGASTSNLSRSSEQTDPASDIFGWTNDNNNLDAVMEAGHRRWMLFPELGYASYGQVEGYSSLKVSDFNMQTLNPVPPGLEYVAMPFRDYPFVLVSPEPQPTPWSLSMVPAGTMSSAFDYFANASVKVTEKATGKQLTVTNLHKDNKGFGLANFLSWMVQNWKYDVDYMVKVSNIRMPDNTTRSVEYPVMVDRFNLFDIKHPRESTDRRQDSNITGKFNTAADEDSFTLFSPGKKNITGRSEFSNWGFFVLVYDENKTLLKSNDAPFSVNFPFDNVTLVISHCDENDLCYQGTQTYEVNIEKAG